MRSLMRRRSASSYSAAEDVSRAATLHIAKSCEPIIDALPESAMAACFPLDAAFANRTSDTCSLLDLDGQDDFRYPVLFSDPIRGGAATSGNNATSGDSVDAADFGAGDGGADFLRTQGELKWTVPRRGQLCGFMLSAILVVVLVRSLLLSATKWGVRRGGRAQHARGSSSNRVAADEPCDDLDYDADDSDTGDDDKLSPGACWQLEELASAEGVKVPADNPVIGDVCCWPLENSVTTMAIVGDPAQLLCADGQDDTDDSSDILSGWQAGEAETPTIADIELGYSRRQADLDLHRSPSNVRDNHGLNDGDADASDHAQSVSSGIAPAMFASLYENALVTRYTPSFQSALIHCLVAVLNAPVNEHDRRLNDCSPQAAGCRSSPSRSTGSQQTSSCSSSRSTSSNNCCQLSSERGASSP